MPPAPPEFRTSRHAMRAFTSTTFPMSPHRHHRTGIEAASSDCQVPHAFFPNWLRKTTAGLRDAWAELNGVISTREKYDAKQREFARAVWAETKATASRECRHCPDGADMNADPQSAEAHAVRANRGAR